MFGFRWLVTTQRWNGTRWRGEFGLCTRGHTATTYRDARGAIDSMEGRIREILKDKNAFPALK
jgi:hypothetical protein